MFKTLIFIALLTNYSQLAAATYTVGTGGSHATIQAAIDAALVAPGSDEIKVATGVFTENIDYTPTGSGNRVEISGGWTNSFTTQADDPSVVDGDAAGSVFNINVGTGDGLTLDKLRIQNGLAPIAAGLLITQYGDSVVEISNCEIVSNNADDDRAEAGGLRVSVNETSQFTLRDSLISNNHAICSGTVDCREGGIGLQAANASTVDINRNVISDNTVTIAEGAAFSGGARLIVYDTATLTFEDNRVTGNSISGTSSAGVGVGVGISGSGTFFARRNWVENNTSNVPVPNSMPQMGFSHFGNGTVIVSDSVIVKGNGQGLRLRTGGDGTSTVHAINLTVAEHAFAGIQAQNTAPAGTLSLSNTISQDNTGDDLSTSGTVGAVTQTNNLISGDALFVNAANSDYSLSDSSPAIDMGTNSPPSGLGPFDIEGNARIAGPTVDIGAYEAVSDVLFLDGFETAPPP